MKGFIMFIFFTILAILHIILLWDVAVQLKQLRKQTSFLGAILDIIDKDQKYKDVI